jgi:hypothetical protein
MRRAVEMAQYTVSRLYFTPMLPTPFKPTSHDAIMPSQPPPPIDANDPEYYTELLTYCDRSEPEPLRLPLNKRQTRRDIVGVQAVDAELSRRLHTLLDAIADISLYEQEKKRLRYDGLVNGQSRYTRNPIVHRFQP